MRMAVSRRPVKSKRGDFARDGFLALKGCVAPSEREAIRSDIDTLLLAPHEPSCSRPNNVLLPLRWCDTTARILLASGRRVQAIRDAVGAIDLRWISGYVSIKEANSGPLAWHQDWWCWDHPVSFRRPAPQVAVLFYLTGTDREHGALRLLPGSHLRSSAIHAGLTAAQAGVVDQLVELGNLAFTDHAEQVTLEAMAGDAVVIDYRLLHGTHANASELRRDCVIVNFAPSWRDLPEDVRAHLISHSALPGPGEATPSWPSWESTLLPRYDGIRRDLRVNRSAPAEFEVSADGRVTRD